jgi:predicted phosphoribosyltransferase
MFFKNRIDAAKQLIPLLNKYIGQDCIVLAVPRGGVPMGCILAEKLHFPLDLLMVKKIGHPHNPEYAIGAVSLEDCLIDKDSGIEMDYFDYETEKLREKMQARYEKFMGKKQPLSLKNKTVIIVDDGIATGYTLKAGIQFIRHNHPKKIVVAVPVAPPEAASEFEKLCDDFVCHDVSMSFQSVGMFYEDFDEVTDEEVIQILKDFNNSILV